MNDDANWNVLVTINGQQGNGRTADSASRHYLIMWTKKFAWIRSWVFEYCRQNLTNHSGPKKSPGNTNLWNQINHFFREIAYWTIFKLFLSSKIDFWPFLKFEIFFFVKLIYLISRVFLAWTLKIFWLTVKYRTSSS